MCKSSTQAFMEISSIFNIPQTRQVGSSIHYRRERIFRYFQAVSDDLFYSASMYNADLLKGDSKAIEGCYGPASAPQLPYYYYAIFDRRLNFAKSLECGLIALREMPAFGSNSLLLTASYYDDSVLKVLPRNHTDPDCDRLPRSYYQFDVTMSSTSAYNPTSCDANTTDTCTSQMLIRYSTFNVPSYTTVQGISAVQILTDEGGILGGAAFLFWYFGIWDLFV